jgi:FkbM family methyltransferase
VADYHYFPNQPPVVMHYEEQIVRPQAAALTQQERCDLYGAFSRTAPTLAPSSFEIGRQVVVRQRGREIAFPNPVPLIKFSHIAFDYENWLERKYALPGFVTVEAGDVVVDCGAYVGGFSLSAVNVAAQVHAFEPEQENFDCVARNFVGVENITLNHAGLYDETKTVTLHRSTSSVEHSLLVPDDGVVVDSVEIQVFSLHDYCAGHGIGGIDFLKLEAEGVELEVFDGLGEMRPRKLAIDVSAERDGQSPADQFIERLAGLGYETHRRWNVLFARRRS